MYFRLTMINDTYHSHLPVLISYYLGSTHTFSSSEHVLIKVMFTTRFMSDSLYQSSCSAIVGAAMSHVRRPHLWTRRTIDEVMTVASKLFIASLNSLGYEFRPGEDILLPLQVK